jgi:osmotically-inducible protein OsmY
MRRNWTAGVAVALTGAALLAGAGTAHAQARTGGGVGSSGLGSSGVGSSGLGGGGIGSSGLGGGGLGGGGLGGGGIGGMSGSGLGSPFGGSSGVGFMGGGGGTFGVSGGSTGGGRGGGFGGSQGYGTTGPEGPYFGNPLSLGVPATTNTTATRTRTFGTLLYNVSTQTGLSSGTGGLGGFGGTAGVSAGRAMGASSYGVRRAPAYLTMLGETVPPARTDMLRVRADLQSIIDRASRIPSRGNIRVLTDGSTVVLRGNVASDRERRLAESLVRLTPGVRSVRNEIVSPESAAAASQP